MNEPQQIEHVSRRVSAVMDQQVSRKEFLRLVGMGAASIVGLAAVAKGLNTLKTPRVTSRAGYSAGPYGR